MCLTSFKLHTLEQIVHRNSRTKNSLRLLRFFVASGCGLSRIGCEMLLTTTSNLPQILTGLSGMAFALPVHGNANRQR
jgi:hypothetical protein